MREMAGATMGMGASANSRVGKNHLAADKNVWQSRILHRWPQDRTDVESGETTASREGRDRGAVREMMALCKRNQKSREPIPAFAPASVDRELRRASESELHIHLQTLEG